MTEAAVREALGHFRIQVVRFHLEPEGPLTFPWYAGSTLRGGFGRAFRQMTCTMGPKQPCPTCPLRTSCPYGVVFETGPGPESEALRTHEEVPRPFVLRPPGPSGEPRPVAEWYRAQQGRPLVFQPGQPIRCEAVLIGQGIGYLAYFVMAFEQLGRFGLGRDRTRFTVAAVDAVEANDGAPVQNAVASRIYDTKTRRLRTLPSGHGPAGRSAGFDAGPVEVRYLSMTRLKHAGRYWPVPPFHVLLRAALRRLSSLSYFHHRRPLDIDFKGLIEQAMAVQIAEHATDWVSWERWSSRQKTSMNLDGTVGRVVYTPVPAAMLPILELAEWVHVGKNTTFGLGQIAVRPLSS